MLHAYHSSFAFASQALSAFPFTSADGKGFRFKAIGRNPNDTSYLSVFDSIRSGDRTRSKFDRQGSAAGRKCSGGPPIIRTAG